MADELGTFFRESQPKLELQADPVEQGDFVVFMRATLSGGEQRDLCEVFQFRR